MDQKDDIVAKFEWLGLFSSEIKVDAHVKTPLDAMCQLWEAKMQYAHGEKDMIVMQHTFEVCALSPSPRDLST